MEKIIEKVRNFNEPFPRIPGKRVYILGAGFSAPLGFPLMGCFVSEGLKLLKSNAWAEQSDDDGQSDLMLRIEKIVDKYLSFFAGHEKDEPSLEDLYCAVDLFSGQMKGNNWINADRDTLCEFVAQVFKLAWEEHDRKLKYVRTHGDSHKLVPTVAQAYFHTPARIACSEAEILPSESLPKNKSEACIYRAFLSQLYAAQTTAPGALKRCAEDYARPAIVSLNYDTVVERKAADFDGKLRIFYGRDVIAPKCNLKDTNIDRDVLPNKTEDVQVLPLIKLHGSLNWRFKNHTLRKHIHVDKRAAVSHGKANCKHCLIFPTWQRDPLGGTVFDTLFREARTHLRLASRIVIIGYSLPPTDRYLNYLLADVTSTPEMPEIEICNRGDPDEWRKRAHKIFGSRLTPGRLTVRGDFTDHVRSNLDPHAPSIL